MHGGVCGCVLLFILVPIPLQVVAKDGGLPPNTNSTNVSIMVLSNTKRLLVMFGCNVSTLYPLQAVIVEWVVRHYGLRMGVMFLVCVCVCMFVCVCVIHSTLNKDVPGYNVTVETIKPHIDPSTGLPVSNMWVYRSMQQCTAINVLWCRTM